jgi:hypothetical protein
VGCAEKLRLQISRFKGSEVVLAAAEKDFLFSSKLRPILLLIQPPIQ